MVAFSLFKANGAAAGAAGFIGDDRAGGGGFGAGNGPRETGTGLVADGRVGEKGGFLSSGFGSGFSFGFGSGFDAAVVAGLGSDLGATAGSGATLGARAVPLAASIADGGSLPSNASPTPAMLETWMMCPHLRHFMRTERPATFSSPI
jgi:hypothetical protein